MQTCSDNTNRVRLAINTMLLRMRAHTNRRSSGSGNNSIGVAVGAELVSYARHAKESLLWFDEIVKINGTAAATCVCDARFEECYGRSLCVCVRVYQAFVNFAL